MRSCMSVYNHPPFLIAEYIVMLAMCTYTSFFRWEEWHREDNNVLIQPTKGMHHVL